MLAPEESGCSEDDVQCLGESGSSSNPIDFCLDEAAIPATRATNLILRRQRSSSSIQSVADDEEDVHAKPVNKKRRAVPPVFTGNPFLHHRLAFNPPPDSMIDPPMLPASINLYINDFTVFYCPSGDNLSQPGRPLAYLDAVMRPTKPSLAPDEEAARKKIGAGLWIYGRIGSLKQADGDRQYCRLKVDRCWVACDTDYKCWLCIQSSGHRIRLVVPLATYGDILHTVWVKSQIVAYICRAVIAQPAVTSVRGLLAILQQATSAAVRRSAVDVRVRMQDHLVVPDDVLLYLEEIKVEFRALAADLLWALPNAGPNETSELKKERVNTLLRVVLTSPLWLDLQRGRTIDLLLDLKRNRPPGQASRSRSPPKSISNTEVVETDPAIIHHHTTWRWLPSSSHSLPPEKLSVQLNQHRRSYYGGIRVDQQELRINDLVLVNLRDSDGRVRPTHGLIRQLFAAHSHHRVGKAKRMAHLQLLRPSIMGQQQELFLDYGQCTDVRVQHMLSKVDFTLLKPGEAAATQSLYAKSVYRPSKGFSIHDPSDLSLDQSGFCDSCAARLECSADVAPQLRCLVEDYVLGSNMLPAVDLFSGGGGTVTGAAQYFNVVSAVDYEGLSCDTLSLNHPSTAVLCADIGALVQRAKVTDTSIGLDLFDRRDINVPRRQQVRVPLLPSQGEVFLLTACPPCQDHSRVNHNPQHGSERNSQLFHALDVVRLLRPFVFLLENVPGFHANKPGETLQNSDNLQNDVKNFAVEAFRQLHQMGYQCRLAELDARSYGSPQHRRRIFFLAAREGIPMPRFPEATHANPDVRATLFAVDPDVQVRGFYLGKGTPGTGPHPAVTAAEAISDLPAFEYAFNDAKEYGRHGRRATFRSERDANNGRDTKIGFASSRPYACPPQNPFQAKKRGECVSVDGQYTPYTTRGEAAIIQASRLHPFAGRKNVSDVPGGYDCVRIPVHPLRSHLRTLAASEPRWRDPHPFDRFKAGREGHWRHPLQRRTFSIAERKRFMGFPDSYRFAGNPFDVDRQLGNAVVVDVAAAIYEQIVVDVVLPWWDKAGRPPDVFEAWKRDHES